MFFRPYYNVWLKYVKNPFLAAVGMLLSVLIPFGVIGWYSGAKITSEVLGLLEKGPEIMAKYQDLFSAYLPNINWAEYTGFVQRKVMGVFSGAFTWVLACIFLIYFVTRPDMRGEDCVKEMPFLKDETRGFVAEQINAFFDIMISFFQRQTKICLLEGCIYGAGFYLVGLPYGFLIGFMLGVLNLCPFLGSIVCMPVALPLAYFFGGSLTRLVLVLVVWVGGLLLDGYVITPKVQGKNTGLGYAGVIFSFIFWGSVFGNILGLLLAIPLSAFCVVLWRSLKSRYIKPII